MFRALRSVPRPELPNPGRARSVGSDLESDPVLPSNNPTAKSARPSLTGAEDKARDESGKSAPGKNKEKIVGPVTRFARLVGEQVEGQPKAR